MITPYLAFSELTKAVYIVYGKRKFNVTDEFNTIHERKIERDCEQAEKDADANQLADQLNKLLDKILELPE